MLLDNWVKPGSQKGGRGSCLKYKQEAAAFLKVSRMINRILRKLYGQMFFSGNGAGECCLLMFKAGRSGNTIDMNQKMKTEI